MMSSPFRRSPLLLPVLALLLACSGSVYANTPVRLTDNEAGDWEPSWSPDGQHIAFSSKRDGDFEIYVMEADGSNLRRLTENEAWDGGPSWSPDGQHIAFSAGSDIYVMDADGRNQRRLTENGGSDPSWSPDGQHIAFVSDRDGNAEIYVMDLAGTASDTPAAKPVASVQSSFALADNYPNPFNPTTTIRYALPQAAEVELTVYNMAGQLVQTLVVEHQSAGSYAVKWDAAGWAAGLYFYRLQAGEFRQVKKMLLLK